MAAILVMTGGVESSYPVGLVRHFRTSGPFSLAVAGTISGALYLLAHSCPIDYTCFFANSSQGTPPN